MKSNFLTSWFYRRTFKKFLKQIQSKVNETEGLWEIDEEMDMLWKLGERGEISALIAYAMVLLRDDKSWYNPDEALSMLESRPPSPPSSGSSPAQWACLTTPTATTSTAVSSPRIPTGQSLPAGSKRRDSKMMKFF